MQDEAAVEVIVCLSARIQELTEKQAHLEAGYHRRAGELDEQYARIKKLRKALLWHGTHDGASQRRTPPCACLSGDSGHCDGSPCSCGLDAALAREGDDQP